MAFMVPELIQGLKNTNTEYGVACAKVLGAIGPKAKPALPALLSATNAGFRLAQSAAFAIWDIDHQTNVVVEILDDILKHQAAARWPVLQELQRRGTALKTVAPIVQQCLFDPNDFVQAEAEKMLRQLSPELLQVTIDQLNRNAPLILQQSIAALQSRTRKIPPRAFTVIEFYGAKAQNAVPALIEVLNRAQPANTSSFGNSMGGQNNFWLPRQAALAIGAIGPAARDAVPALTNLLGRRDLNAENYCKALSGIGSNAVEAVPHLEKLLGSPSSYDFAAARALMEIAPSQSSNAVNILKKAAEGQERFGRSRFLVGRAPNAVKQGRFQPTWYPSSKALSAQVALWKVGMEKNPPVTNLMAILSNSSPIPIQKS